MPINRLLCVVAIAFFAAAQASALNAQEMRQLRGTVFDENKKPLPNLTVHVVRQVFGRRFRQNTLATQTDERGKFEFKDVAENGQKVYLRVSICHEGFLLTWQFIKLSAGQHLEPLTFELGRARKQTFRIVDESGEPLRNTAIFPAKRVAPDGTTHVIFSQNGRSISKTTDAQGHVVFEYFNRGDKVTLGVTDGIMIKPARIGEGEAPVDCVFSKPQQNRNSRLPKDKTPDPAHVHWVAKNTVPFQSIAPGDESFEDLQPLKGLIGNARVVALGEQSHRDGACFETKIRLIKFLHQEMGFDVIAFESGLYDCRVAWREFQNGAPPQQAARQGVFGIWTQSQQVQPLFEYIGKAAKRKQPLELAGFDCQFTAPGALSLPDSLREFLATLDAPEIDEKFIDDLCTKLETLIKRRRGEGELNEFLSALDIVSSVAARQGAEDLRKQREAAFWAQLAKSLKAQSQSTWNGPRSQRDLGLRDRQMGENLIWLAREYYPKRKIIVWAASFHLARNIDSVTPYGPGLSYDKTVTMGHVAHKALGKDFFSIAFTAGGGEVGTAFRSQPLDVAPAGTLEDLFYRAKIQNGFLSLRPTAAKQLMPIYSRPLGYRYMEADWTGVFDAIIFNRTMTPSTRQAN